MINLENCLLVSFILFTIGVVGVLIRRNAVIILVGIELMLNAVNIALVGFASFGGWVEGQAFVVVVIAMTACEVAVGFAIIYAAFSSRLGGTVDVDDFNIMKH